MKIKRKKKRKIRLINSNMQRKLEIKKGKTKCVEREKE